MANLELLKNVISTQYNDMKGLAAIDGHDRSYLNSMCSDHGVNLNEWCLIGLELYDSEPIGTEQLTVYAYLIKKVDDSESYDDLKERLTHMDNVEIHKKSFRLSYEELGRYIKRINIGVLSELPNYIKSAHFVEDDD